MQMQAQILLYTIILHYLLVYNYEEVWNFDYIERRYDAEAQNTNGDLER